MNFSLQSQQGTAAVPQERHRCCFLANARNMRFCIAYHTFYSTFAENSIQTCHFIGRIHIRRRILQRGSCGAKFTTVPPSDRHDWQFGQFLLTARITTVIVQFDWLLGYHRRVQGEKEQTCHLARILVVCISLLSAHAVCTASFGDFSGRCDIAGTRRSPRN